MTTVPPRDPSASRILPDQDAPSHMPLERDRSLAAPHRHDDGATRYAVRGATSLTLLNGAAAIALLVIAGNLPEAGAERVSRLTNEIMMFGWGAAAGALCFLLGWITQTLRAEGPDPLLGNLARRPGAALERVPLLRILRLLGVAAGIISAALFLIGLRGSAAGLEPKTLSTISIPEPTTTAPEPKRSTH